LFEVPQGLRCVEPAPGAYKRISLLCQLVLHLSLPLLLFTLLCSTTTPLLVLCSATTMLLLCQLSLHLLLPLLLFSTTTLFL